MFVVSFHTLKCIWSVYIQSFEEARLTPFPGFINVLCEFIISKSIAGKGKRSGLPWQRQKLSIIRPNGRKDRLFSDMTLRILEVSVANVTRGSNDGGRQIADRDSREMKKLVETD